MPHAQQVKPANLVRPSNSQDSIHSALGTWQQQLAGTPVNYYFIIKITIIIIIITVIIIIIIIMFFSCRPQEFR